MKAPVVAAVEVLDGALADVLIGPLEVDRLGATEVEGILVVVTTDIEVVVGVVLAEAVVARVVAADAVDIGRLVVDVTGLCVLAVVVVGGTEGATLDETPHRAQLMT